MWYHPHTMTNINTASLLTRPADEKLLIVGLGTVRGPVSGAEFRSDASLGMSSYSVIPLSTFMHVLTSKGSGLATHALMEMSAFTIGFTLSDVRVSDQRLLDAYTAAQKLSA